MAKRTAPGPKDDFIVTKLHVVDKYCGVPSDDICQRLKKTAEHRRLEDSAWRQWGPYLSERQWGTVREDHSDDGNCWQYLSHSDAVYYAYESGDDGLLGVCDDHGELCLALALWNGKDQILKERLFGLSASQGNHGEDVKELYYYRDSTPTHSYMRAEYKYPVMEFPYKMLKNENCRRTLQDTEFELVDTGVFDAGFWHVTVEYAKNSPCDILCRYTVCNESSEAADIHLLPTLWFRNTWSTSSETPNKPVLRLVKPGEVHCTSQHLGEYVLRVDCQSHDVDIVFTDNETNAVMRSHVVNMLTSVKPVSSSSAKADTAEPVGASETTTACSNSSTTHCAATAAAADTDDDDVDVDDDAGRSMSDAELSWLLSNDDDDSSADSHSYTKAAFHRYIIAGQQTAVNADKTGTKCAAVHCLTLQPHCHAVVCCRLHSASLTVDAVFGRRFDAVFSLRELECHEFYTGIIPRGLSAEEELIVRQAFAGLCWSKQFYRFDGSSLSSSEQDFARNADWDHLECCDIISMPDKWEFPWFAAWDLAFHMIPMSVIDPVFAKSQLLLLLSHRYQHPNGQLPAYEFNFSDVNPPVHAWSCLHVYDNTAPRDIEFLRRCFHSLVPNFTWWLNRKDSTGKCMFHAGFLGMDNISCVDRSNLPSDCTRIDQVDGSAWMAFYALCMIRIAVELSLHNDSQQLLYEDQAIIYLKHFCRIQKSLNDIRTGLWDVNESFYYDRLHVTSQPPISLCIRSLVGLLPLIAIHVFHQSQLCCLPRFSVQLLKYVDASMQLQGTDDCICLSLVNKQQLRSLLCYLLSEDEFLAPYGIRSLSKYHLKKPFCLELADEVYSISYCPDESTSALFGGNSNWRGPVWLNMNYLLLEAVDTYASLCDDLVPSVTSLSAAAADIRRRLTDIFMLDHSAQRPVHAGAAVYMDERWRDLILFYEYYNPDSGRGLGASHQTGWSALIASVLLSRVDHHR